MAKGINFLNRSTQVHFMRKCKDLLDFPAAPNLAGRQAQPEDFW